MKEIKVDNKRGRVKIKMVLILVPGALAILTRDVTFTFFFNLFTFHTTLKNCPIS